MASNPLHSQKMIKKTWNLESKLFNLLSMCSKNYLGGILNFEKAPLKLQRFIKWKRQWKEGEKEWKMGGREPKAACGKNKKEQGQSDFLGQKF